MKGTSHTNFKNGATLKNVPQAKYLGITVNEKASNKPDLGTTITDTLATITALKYFWKSSAKASWQLLVFNVVVGAKKYLRSGVTATLRQRLPKIRRFSKERIAYNTRYTTVSHRQNRHKQVCPGSSGESIDQEKRKGTRRNLFGNYKA